MNRLIIKRAVLNRTRGRISAGSGRPTAIRATKQPLYRTQRDVMLSTSYEWSQMIYAKDPSRQQHREMPLCLI